MQKRFVIGLLLLAVVGVVVFALSRSRPDMGFTSEARRDRLHEQAYTPRSAEAQRLLAGMRSPLKHDVQALPKRCRPACPDDYDPVVALRATIHVPAVTSPADLASGRPLAVIWTVGDGVTLVDQIGIVGSGDHFVYVRFEPSTSTWSAWMERPGNEPRLDLLVRAVDYDDAANLPAAAAWDWDHTAKRVLIGVRCATHWCYVRPADGASDVIGEPFQVPDESATAWKTERYPGWSDQQLLAEKKDGQLKKSQSFGIVTPHPDLENRPGEEQRWEEVGRLRIRGKDYQIPIPTFPKLKRGRIYSIEMKRDGQDSSTATYHARLMIGGEQIGPDIELDREDHTNEVPIPGTLRWEWHPLDEKLWIRCGAGCCRSTR